MVLPEIQLLNPEVWTHKKGGRYTEPLVDFSIMQGIRISKQLISPLKKKCIFLLICSLILSISQHLYLRPLLHKIMPRVLEIVILQK